jgi:hypothetical protein
MWFGCPITERQNLQRKESGVINTKIKIQSHCGMLVYVFQINCALQKIQSIQHPTFKSWKIFGSSFVDIHQPLDSRTRQTSKLSEESSFLCFPAILILYRFISGFRRALAIIAVEHPYGIKPASLGYSGTKFKENSSVWGAGMVVNTPQNRKAIYMP